MFIDAKLHNARGVQVLLDGKDISGDCYAVDDKRGIALCFQVTPDGHKFVDPNNRNRAAREMRKGNIKIMFREKV